MSDWGPWRLNAETYVLETTEGYGYEIDLEQCLDSAQVLDWLAQVAGKTWATPEVVAGLLRAIDDVIGLQSHICGSGIPGKVTPSSVRHRARSMKASTN